VITSDTKVVISGLSSLTLSDLRIVAPEIELRSDGHISLGSGVSLEVGPAQTDSSGVVTGSSVVITSGGHGTPTVYAATGATLSVGGATAGDLVVGSSGGLTILSHQQVVSAGTIAGVPNDGSAASQEDPAPAESGGGAGRRGVPGAAPGHRLPGVLGPSRHATRLTSPSGQGRGRPAGRGPRSPQAQTPRRFGADPVATSPSAATNPVSLASPCSSARCAPMKSTKARSGAGRCRRLG